MKQLELDFDEPTAIVKAYAHTSYESMIEYGEAVGLVGEALDFFRYATEFELNLTVERKTGKVLKVEVVT